LQQAIDEFEASFRSPLSPERWFRMSYVPERTAFIRSLGDEFVCVVAEMEGRVMGIMEVALVRLHTPEGGECLATYVADVKLRPEARRSISTARLIQRASTWRPHVPLGFSIVLNETSLKPSDYSGRLGIPSMAPVASLAIVRMPTLPDAGTCDGDGRFVSDRESAVKCYRTLTRGRYAAVVRSPLERSEAKPGWFVHPGGQACGRFEDRRKVRRMIADDGSEKTPAYLSCFAFNDPDAAIDILSVAQRYASSQGFSALRVCMAERDLHAIQRIVGPKAIRGMGATIYATEACSTGVEWNVNAAEV
jgi:hypothetical protein